MKNLTKRFVSAIAIIGMIVSMSVFNSSLAATKLSGTSFKKVTYNKKNRSVKLTWKRVKKATGYQIQYSTKSNFKGKKTVKIKKNKTVSKTIKKLKINNMYYFKIRTFKTVKKKGKTKTTYSKFSAVKTLSTSSLPATTLTGGYYDPSDETITLSWVEVAGIDGYEIQESTKSNFSNSAYYQIDDPAATSFSTADISKDKTYYYRICTYKNIKGKVVYSNYSAPIIVGTSFKIAIPEFTGVNYVSKDQAVTLTWNKIDNVSGYYVETSYLSDFSDEEIKHEYIESNDITSVEFREFLINKTYYFRVCGFVSTVIDGEVARVFGKFSQVKTVDTKPYYSTPQALDEKTVNKSTMTSDITGMKYKLKFFDDFNGTKLNSSYWTFDEQCAGGAEVQANVPENLDIRDGNAILTADKDTKLHNQYRDGSGSSVVGRTYYTGAKFNSRDKVYYKYGRFEMYAKMPMGSGAWPAFWTLGQGKGWPWGGEIDILEMAGFDYGYVSAVHWCEPDEPQSSAYGSGHLSEGGIASVLSDTNQVKLADAYHVIGMEWTPTNIHFYFDGQESGDIKITRKSMSQAMHCSHFMIINYALGGMGGPVDDSVFPQNMYVDWVKVWQTY